MPDSLAALQQAAAQAPDNIDRWVDLCEAAEKLHDYTEVLRAGDAIVRIAPDKAQAHFIRGLALHHLDRIEEALTAYQRALAIDPGYLDAIVNIGICSQMLNRLTDAEQAFRRAIEVSGQTVAGDGVREVEESEYGAQHWNLAQVELLKGDYKPAFVHYRARFKAIPYKQRPKFSQPLWRGEDLRGKTILITGDQGYGDSFMMMRYLPLLRERGARVVLRVSSSLMPYLKDWPGSDDVINSADDTYPFDVHAWEFDLPRLFGTTLDTIPARIPYLPLLPPDEATRLPDNGRPRIGVIWSGNPEHHNDKRRSIPLPEFKPLFAAQNVDFYSLNRDMRLGDAELLAQFPVADLKPRLIDFAATARFVGQLDLVISCDTSIVHLAGGMGKPVWTLLPFAPSWHWMLDREDSPWYPTVRLFRQKSRGDWADVIQRVAKALAQR